MKSIDLFFEEFKNWGKVSEASMNADKTKILAVNSSYDKYKGAKFVSGLKMLGIIFNKKGIDKTNFENCKSKIEKTLIMWNGIRFNIIDKITVLRTFGFSKLWYLLNFICLYEKEIKDLKQ